MPPGVLFLSCSKSEAWGNSAPERDRAPVLDRPAGRAPDAGARQSIAPHRRHRSGSKPAAPTGRARRERVPGLALASEAGPAVLREIRDGLKNLTLDRPATSNALSAAIVEALLCQVRESAHDRTRTLVSRATGPNFCAGLDRAGLEEACDADLLARFVRSERLLQSVCMAQFDTVACAKGAADGAGADLSAACRYRLADPSARFAMPGLQFGLALGTRRFAALVGEMTERPVMDRRTSHSAISVHSYRFQVELLTPPGPDLAGDANLDDASMRATHRGRDDPKTEAPSTQAGRIFGIGPAESPEPT